MVLFRIMERIRTISFRIGTEKLTALDSLATASRRDRTFLLNEAVENYILLQTHHDELVHAGMKAAEEGRYLENSAMRKRLTKLVDKRLADKRQTAKRKQSR